MALKIEFAAEFKDAERIQKILNDLNDQMAKLAQTGQAVGQGASSGFQSLTQSLKGFDDATKGLRSIKELSESVASLSKLQGEVGIIDKMFSDIGRSISRGIGDEKVDQIRKVREEIGKLRQDSEKAKVLIQEAEYNYKLAQARGDEASMAAFSMQRRGSAIMAAQKEREVQAAENELWEMEHPHLKRMGLGRNFLKLGMPSMAGMMGAASIMAAAAPAALAIGAGIEQAGTRAGIAEQNLRTALASDLMQGDFTRLALREMGFGLGQTDSAVAKGYRVLSLVPGNVARFLSGQTTQGLDEITATQMKEREDLDVKLYGEAIRPISQQLFARRRMYSEAERAFGQEQVDRALYGLNRAGVSQARARETMEALREQDILGTEADLAIFNASRLGYGKDFQKLLAQERRAAGPTAALDLMNRIGYITGLAGEQSNVGRGYLGAALVPMTADFVGISRGDVYQGYLESVGRSVSLQRRPGSTYSEKDAVEAAGMAFQSAQRALSQGSPLDIVSMSVMSNLGVTDPTQQFAIKNLIKSGQTSKAYALMSEITGKPAKDIGQAMESQIGGAAKAFEDIAFESSVAGLSKKSAGLIKSAAIAGRAGIINQAFIDKMSEEGTTASILDVFRPGVSGGVPLPAQTAQAGLMARADLDRGEEAEGRKEKAVTDMMGLLKETSKEFQEVFSNVIAKGFETLAYNVKVAATDLSIKRTEDLKEKERAVRAAKTLNTHYGSRRE